MMLKQRSNPPSDHTITNNAPPASNLEIDIFDGSSSNSDSEEESFENLEADKLSKRSSKHEKSNYQT